MKTILPFLCLAVLGCWFLWSTLAHPSRRDVAANQESAVASEPAPELADPDSSGKRVAAGDNAGLSAVPPDATALPTVVTPEGPAPIGSRPAVPPFDDEALSRKYEGATVPELIKAYQQKGEERKTEAARLQKQVLQNGPFEEQFLPEGSKTVEHAGSGDGRPTTFAFSTEPVNGGTVIKHANLSDPVLYPEYRSLELEWDWLHKRLHALGGCACPGA